MKSKSARFKTMQAIVRNSQLYGVVGEFLEIENELLELAKCERIQPLKRRRLIQLLHASRAIDTCLSSILRHHGQSPKTGIGSMLSQVSSLSSNHYGQLNTNLASAYKPKIAYPRNKYAHKADSYPSSELEINTYISDVHSCLAAILV